MAIRMPGEEHSTEWSYNVLKKAVHNRSLPLVLVDLDRFDANVRYYATKAQKAGKTVRVASKSLRVPTLIQRAFAVGGPSIRGLMCYSASEAAYLADAGFDDLLIGYPSCDPHGNRAAARAILSGKRVTFAIDCHKHAAQLVELHSELNLPDPLRVCIDADVSWRSMGFHLGAQRSPIRTVSDFEQMLNCISKYSELQFAGVIAYESQIAGIPDTRAGDPGYAYAVRFMKGRSIPDVLRKREQIIQAIIRRGLTPEIFNGGGTGSFVSTIQDPSVNEITVGSGLLQSHLFDLYRDNPGKPAICFALEVTRRPQANRVACQGGGFIASGAGGRDRWPVPILPRGLLPEAREGFGEVQTPLIVSNSFRDQLDIGDPVFFRPAKSGEIAERFNEYHLFQGQAIVEQVATYRGLGQCFH